MQHSNKNKNIYLEKHIFNYNELLNMTDNVNVNELILRIENQLNALAESFKELKKMLHTGDETRLLTSRTHLIMTAFILNGGRASIDEIYKTLTSLGINVNLKRKSVSNIIQSLKSHGLLFSTSKGIYECKNLRKWLLKISQSPASSYLNKIDNIKANEIVERLFIEYCRENKSFHIRRDFLNEVKKDVGSLYVLIEKHIPNILFKLKEKGVIETETGHDGLQIGEGLPIAYISYKGDN